MGSCDPPPPPRQEHRGREGGAKLSLGRRRDRGGDQPPLGEVSGSSYMKAPHLAVRAAHLRVCRCAARTRGAVRRSPFVLLEQQCGGRAEST